VHLRSVIHLRPYEPGGRVTGASRVNARRVADLAYFGSADTDGGRSLSHAMNASMSSRGAGSLL
jgi:hypothetical protein